MVKKGSFTLELVDAETEEPFKEHIAPDGTTYVEAEPDLEYFIRTKSELSNQRVAIKFYVDGKSLGYAAYLKEGAKSYCGLWSVRNFAEKLTALRFHKTAVFNNSITHETKGLPLWTGKVTAKFYEAEECGEVMQEETVDCSWHMDEVVYVRGVTHCQKKGVVSTEGDTSLTRDVPRTKPDFEIGNLLCSITVRYCTAVGLIHAGILPKPPLWDFHRMKYSRARSQNDQEVVNILALPTKKIRIQSTQEDGTVLSTQEYELFDLTCDEDDETRGNNDTHVTAALHEVHRSHRFRH